MTRRSVPTKVDSERLDDQGTVATAEITDLSFYHQPPRFQQGHERILERVEKDEDVVGWFVQLLRTMGTDDQYLASRLLDQVINVAVRPERMDKDSGEADANSALAAVNGIGPRDTLEGLLSVQMVATHNAAMSMLQKATLPEQNLHGSQAYINLSTKLLRTFTAQVECLQRYRGKTTKQQVTVEHVHINEGGQAIVGAVSHEKGQGGKS